MTSGVICENHKKINLAHLFVEKITFCKSKAEIKILLFSSELGTQSTQDYPDIVVNFWLLGNDRTAHICSAIVVEGHQASEFHILLTKITERLIMYLERLFLSLDINKWVL